ncbi:hypothetical protein D9O36_09400 [Zobellia amurskyensis]|uniref:RteC protein n=1 Tax=Zobellia amurskyensis TaxID=248905 RepID=A0A7X2ZTE7_9FLAO|nr:hypothetical protein [Zobellia amurskyensis]MUH36056.1 hypothetical protein [Zobellia amurskyensis]
MENEYKSLNNTFLKISKLLMEEENLKFPPHYPLKSSAEKIICLLQDSVINDDKFKNWRYWKIQDLKNFIADLVGELYHDYDNRNKRYRGKWVLQKRKIDGVIANFKSEFIDQIIPE